MREARGPAWTDWLHERGVVALTGIDTRRSCSSCATRRDAGGRRLRATRLSRRRWRRPRAAVDGGPCARRAPCRPRSRTSTPRRAARASRSSTTACKRSVLRRLAAAGAAFDVYPHDVDADELAGYDGVLLSTGPGDPEPLQARSQTVRELLGRTRVLGICLGHQVLAMATGHDDVQASVRPSRREPSRAQRADRPRARHEPEPRLRRRATDAQRGDARLALRRDRRRARLPRAARAVAAVPPGGGPRPARCVAADRELGRGARACPKRPTSRRSASSAPARS